MVTAKLFIFSPDSESMPDSSSLIERVESSLYSVVDEEDNGIGTATRNQVHTQGLIHRSVLFYIMNHDGQIFVNQRTKNKEFYQEHWSIVLGGHVHLGESYEQALIRECKEEVQITFDNIIYMNSFKKRQDFLDRENIQVYSVISNQAPILDSYEIKQGRFMNLSEIDAIMKKEKFLPETDILYTMLKIFKLSTAF
jgi:isopentenyl-diphosphate Delta-isomerase